MYKLENYTLLIKIEHTICSVVKSNNRGPRIAGAKNLRKINPDTTEYRTCLS